MAITHINKQPLTFPIKACVAFLPPQSRLTCNQYAVIHYSLSYQCWKPIVLSTSSLSKRHRSVHFHSALLHLPDTFNDAFSSSLSTITFDYSTMKWFIYSSRKAYMRDQPSSLIQHWKEFTSFPFVTHSSPTLAILLLAVVFFCLSVGVL